METTKNDRVFFNCEMRSQKDEEHGTYISGRPIVYDSIYDNGYFKETIDRGALDGCDLKDVKFLVNHNTNMIPLARSRNNNKNSTMQLSPCDEGMDMRVNLDIENNSDARSLNSAVERGDISGMSFMFTIDGEEWEGLDSDYPTRHITKISKVFEVSAVTFPAYEDTTLTARSKSVLDNARSALDSAKKNNSDDNTLELLKLKNQILGGI